MMNKRGESGDSFSDVALNWALVRLPILTFVTVFFLIALNSYYSTGLDSYDVENTIFIKRIMNSDNLLAYRDPATGRIFPGIVDSRKFSTEHIEKNLMNQNNRLAAYMELEYLDSGDVLKAYVNKERAVSWDDYVFVDGFDSTSINRYVRIYDNGEFIQGILRIKVFVRNE